MKSILLVTFTLSLLNLSAQSLSVDVSTDSLLFGNPLQVTFTIEGASAEAFEAPDFEDFRSIGGPSYSTSMSIINGEVSQKASITYVLEAAEVGVFYIPPAFLESNGKTLETQPVEVLVVPNPDGVRQEPPRRSDDWMNGGMDFEDFFRPLRPDPTEPPREKTEKKKRKIYKF